MPGGLSLRNLAAAALLRWLGAAPAGAAGLGSLLPPDADWSRAAGAAGRPPPTPMAMDPTDRAGRTFY
jgi:hypothetical protein